MVIPDLLESVLLPPLLSLELFSIVHRLLVEVVINMLHLLSF